MNIFEAIGTGIVIFSCCFTIAGLSIIGFFGLRSLKESHQAGRALEYSAVMDRLPDALKDYVPGVRR